MNSAQHTVPSRPRPMKPPMKVSIVVAVALFLVLMAINQPLKTGSAPQGIVSFQLAGTADQAYAIIRSWRENGLIWAQMSLWVDFLFIAAYLAALLQLTRHFTRDRPGIRERKVARWVRALFITAGLSDVAENIVLLNNLSPPTDSMSMTATILALIKFTGLLLGVAGLVIIRAARRHPLSHS
ncbi:hypothetical protein [Marinobacter shengliensis]|uniref:hypothetical protein n=1 Tax=Marinobacter shengliensis TaxID=1389223 RepID=UPI001E4E2ED5|nr:hypothetical protein [Marinobacter shengliensis]MCD1629434.1 hypothetical protein [Marinobacter shengliensis]